MTHLPIAPVLIAAFSGFLLTLASRAPLAFQRAFSLLATAAGFVAAAIGLHEALNGPLVYALSNWPAPFGIVLVLDRLSGLMITLTATVALLALLAAVRGWDERGRLFHPLYQFQLMGLYGAFLTGDIFNLFVFFEILLIASYGLLLHGRGPGRSRAGIKYVVVNLTGSALFLVAVGTLYGVTGTLNMADLAQRIPHLSPADLPLLRASALLFLVVFGTKAAVIPLFFWLPDAYSNASSPVASLFTIMTKVGVYAILRVYTLAFGAPSTGIGGLAADFVMAAALTTLAVGMLGSLQARSLRRLIAYQAIASVGTMLTAVGLFTVAGISAGLFYMIQSTLTLAALFLLADLVCAERGAVADALTEGTGVRTWAPIGLLFMALAISVAGVPPLGGFLGKVMILDGARDHAWSLWVWAIVLSTSLVAVVSMSRAGSVLFWKSHHPDKAIKAVDRGVFAPVCGLLALVVGLTILAGPVSRFTRSTAADLMQPSAYIEAVLSNRTVITKEGGDQQ